MRKCNFTPSDQWKVVAVGSSPDCNRLTPWKPVIAVRGRRADSQLNKMLILKDPCPFTYPFDPYLNFMCDFTCNYTLLKCLKCFGAIHHITLHYSQHEIHFTWFLCKRSLKVTFTYFIVGNLCLLSQIEQWGKRPRLLSIYFLPTLIIILSC